MAASDAELKEHINLFFKRDTDMSDAKIKEHIKNLFFEADTDRSGYLSFEELRVFLTKNGYHRSYKEMENHLKAFDYDGDNKITLDEFMRGMGSTPDECHRYAIYWKTFCEYDVDGSGELSRNETKLAMEKGQQRPVSDAEVDALFTEMDKDGSGTIEFDEFYSYICQYDEQS